MKKAFTMLELIFVIVVMGIIIAVVTPNTRSNPLQEAAVQLASHIRYTQHLAMMDDRFNPNKTHSSGDAYVAANSPIWYRERWQLAFYSNAYTDGAEAYTIFSDTVNNSTGNAQASEIAKNPENSAQIMTGGYGSANAIDYNDPEFIGMKKLNIGKTYGVTSVDLEGGCANSRLSFDHLGRPLQGDHATMTGPYSAGTQRLITSDCTITLSDATDSIVLHIEPETGFVSVAF